MVSLESVIDNLHSQVYKNRDVINTLVESITPKAKGDYEGDRKEPEVFVEILARCIEILEYNNQEIRCLQERVLKQLPEPE